MAHYSLPSPVQKKPLSEVFAVKQLAKILQHFSSRSRARTQFFWLYVQYTFQGTVSAANITINGD